MINGGFERPDKWKILYFCWNWRMKYWLNRNWRWKKLKKSMEFPSMWTRWKLQQYNQSKLDFWQSLQSNLIIYLRLLNLINNIFYHLNQKSHKIHFINPNIMQIYTISYNYAYFFENLHLINKFKQWFRNFHNKWNLINNSFIGALF